jgi:hypothetical protein
MFLATRLLVRSSGPLASILVKELADLLQLRWDDALASIPDVVDCAIESGRAPPFVAAELIATICAARADAEVLALGLADMVLVQNLKWPKPVPLLLPERFGPAFGTIGGRGRIRPGEPAYTKAICLAVVGAWRRRYVRVPTSIAALHG